MKTNSIEPIIALCNSLTVNDCVLFDIDEVIIHMQDAVLQTSKRRTFMNDILYPSNYNGVPYYSATIWPQAQLRIIDQKIFELLALLSDNAIPHMGLTAGWAGNLGIHEQYHTIRAERLAQLGVVFNHASVNDSTFVFKDMSNYNRHPIFYRNILFCCKIPKHLVLERFIIVTNKKPDRVVFIDDSLDNLENVSAWCKQHHIIFYGFHYTQADYLKKELNQSRALFQINYLQSNDIWLSDQQADDMIQSNKTVSDHQQLLDQDLLKLHDHLD